MRVPGGKYVQTVLVRSFALVVSGLLLSNCSKPSTAPVGSENEAAAPISFVNRVWKVSKSTAVAPGTLYVFVSEGTLLITSADSKPALGKWKSEGSALTMVEEGIAREVDVQKLSKNEFQITVHSPGAPVEITLVPATGY